MVLFAVILSFFFTLLLQVNCRESAALLSLKASVDDPSRALSSWRTGIDVCKWNGVSCNGEGNVSGLALQNLTLSGSSLAKAILALSLLLKLSVTGSNIQNTINVSTACSLEEINLSGNWNLSLINFGTLVTSCKEMKLLNLSNSQMSGELPLVTIGNALEVMDLSKNLLSGGLSSSLFSNCMNLRYIEVSQNDLTRELSEDLIENCTGLERISLAHNNFQGTSFPSIQFLPSLEFLDASFNNFSGTIPTVHPNLRHLNLSSNSFTNASSHICTSGSSSRLESLIIVNNKLTGGILDRVMNCSMLKMLDLSFNSITGEIPGEICSSLPGLQHFLGLSNNLQGTVPSRLASCTNLNHIILSLNDLTGSIPWESLFELKKLQWLSLSNNKFTGQLPHSLEVAAQLIALQVSNNSLEGTIPEKVGVRILDLRGNSFSGQIPNNFNGYTGRKFVSVNVSETSLRLAAGRHACGCVDNVFLFQGISEEQLGKLLKEKSGGCGCTLGILPAISYNNFGSSPTFVDISHNRLVGDIPGNLGTMDYLRYLSIAHNFLSGTIPEELGQLENIVGMDLSYNGLQGSIPSSFQRLSFITWLNVSYNSLSGPIPQGGQFDTLDSSGYIGNAGLCGRPLASCRIIPEVGGAEDDDSGDSFQVVIIGFGFGLLGFVLGFATVIHIGRKKCYLERAFK